MRQYFDIRGRNILRWLCSLSAALLAEHIVRYLLGTIVRLDRSNIFGFSNFEGYVTLLLLYVLPASALVTAGAFVAPSRLTAAIALTLFIVARSLMQHLLIQHLVGRRVGITNYTHFCAESAGALSVALYIAWKTGKDRRKDITA